MSFKELKERLHERLKDINTPEEAQEFLKDGLPYLKHIGKYAKALVGDKADAVIDGIIRSVEMLTNIKTEDTMTEYVGWQVQAATDTVVSIGADDFNCAAQDIATVNPDYFFNSTPAGVLYVGREAEGDPEPNAECLDAEDAPYNPEPASIFGGHPVKPPGTL